MRRRAMRISQLSAGVILAAAVAPWLGVAAASADPSTTPPPSGDDGRATSYVGNVTTCADIGFPGDTQVDDTNLAASGFDITVGTQYVDVNAVPAGEQIDALVVKGGDGYNLYAAGVFATLPAQGLHAPLVGDPPTNVPTISHWFLCAGPATPTPQTAPSPTVSFFDSCDKGGIVVTLGNTNGTAPAQFSVTYGGTSQTVSLDAGKTADVTVPVGEDSTGSVTVSAAGLAGSPVTHAWSRNCASDGNTGGGNDSGGTNAGGGTDTGTTTTITPSGTAAPTVDASNGCATGISVELGDMNGTAPVTFTVTKPDGTAETVDVRVGQIVKRSYDVADGTTGVVTVSAPGLAAKTFSYAKSCTQVLGEKVSKSVKPTKRVQSSKTPDAAVSGRRAAQLPFTGFPTGRALALGALLTAAGVVLTVAPRRRYPARHAARG